MTTATKTRMDRREPERGAIGVKRKGKGSQRIGMTVRIPDDRNQSSSPMIGVSHTAVGLQTIVAMGEVSDACGADRRPHCRQTEGFRSIKRVCLSRNRSYQHGSPSASQRPLRPRGIGGTSLTNNDRHRFKLNRRTTWTGTLTRWELVRLSIKSYGKQSCPLQSTSPV